MCYSVSYFLFGKSSFAQKSGPSNVHTVRKTNRNMVLLLGITSAIGVALIIIVATKPYSFATRRALYCAGSAPLAGWAIWRFGKMVKTCRSKLPPEELEWIRRRIEIDRLSGNLRGQISIVGRL